MTKHTIEVDLKWYETRQNNSGGSFYVDKQVAQHVLVQASSAKEANRRMKEITESTAQYWCECCGERWYFDFDESDGTDEPTIYGEPLNEYEAWSSKHEARLHHYDGTVEAVQLKK